MNRSCLDFESGLHARRTRCADHDSEESGDFWHRFSQISKRPNARVSAAALYDRTGRRRLRTLVRRRRSDYSTGMKLAFELPQAQAEKLRAEAQRLGLTPEDLARAALADLLGTPDAEFRAAAGRILQKNQELYRRLA